MRVAGISAAFALVVVSSVSGWSEDHLRVVDSPSGLYRCQISPNPGGGEEVHLASTQAESPRRLVFTSIRGASVMWSPTDEWFAVVDALDGHMTDLHVFHVVDVSGEANAWRIDEVYTSPSRLQYDTHWALVAWDIPEGTITVSCHFRDTGASTGSGSWFTRKYDVPIDPKPIRNQVPDPNT